MTEPKLVTLDNADARSILLELAQRIDPSVPLLVAYWEDDNMVWRCSEKCDRLHMNWMGSRIADIARGLK